MTRTFDDLNRVNVIEASYFDVSVHQIADYDYTGPFRIRKKTLGASSGNRKNASYLLPG